MKKLLLSSVFGPFGVDDAFGRKENLMELMHNQVTREQGLFSLRFNHASFGLYFLAENVQTPTTVLDFSSLARFRREVAKGYDTVGISFIIPNFEKARRMAQIVRDVSPSSRIVLGGHGTNIPGIERLIEHDAICHGEGVGFLRRYLGEDPDRPIRHPVLHSSYHRQVMGVPVPEGAAVLVPGVGCANKCRFCATSHFFGSYTSYLQTGRDVYDACCAAEAELGVTDFGVLDENFLKVPQRAHELLDLMEENGKRFTFGIFSSAETLSQFGDLDLLVRLGVNFLWMGVESRKEVYEKNRGIDFRTLVAELRRRGVAVMTSAILFLEHHSPETIGDEIDFAIGLGADFVQFMQLGPIPGTKLYDDYAREGKLLADVPWAEQHGQDRIWFAHPAFSRDETRAILRDAFAKDYATSGPSMLRNMQTTLRGYRYAATHADPRVRVRAEGFRDYAIRLRPFVGPASTFARNRATARLAADLRSEYRSLFGAPTAKDRLLSVAIGSLAAAHSLRTALAGDVRQPGTILRTYRQPGSRGMTQLAARLAGDIPALTAPPEPAILRP